MKQFPGDVGVNHESKGGAKNLLESIHKQEKFEKTDLNVVEVLVYFLKLFEEATRTLEGDSTSTI